MLTLLIWLLIFFVSLFILIKGSDYFTNSAEKIGLHFEMPAFIVGVTIVALGTSLPELVTSVIAVLQGSSEIVAGDIVGSNIANICLVLGFAVILNKKLKLSYELAYVDLPLLIGSAFFLVITFWDGKFTFMETIIFLAGMAIYLTYALSSKKERDRDVKKELKKVIKIKDKKRFDWKILLMLVLGMAFIYLGAKYIVDSIIALSDIVGIGKEIIAMSIVAVGTSLPELSVSIVAARKSNPEMAVGNVLGSNIFNTFSVVGISGLFGTLLIPKSIISFGLPVMLMATLLYYVITRDKVITKWEGWLLILFYILFMGKLFNLF